ncbi:MAG: YabP/YqfC family sporulation protein [Lachnospiraceae bacterium]|nr:YabP/YqfC family sporulation protein [Lachnospiraceae bacterium]
MEFASDVTEGSFLLSMTGKERLWLENYESILVYNDREVVIMARRTRIRIQGDHLCIESYGSVEMKLKGNIDYIQFEGL